MCFHISAKCSWMANVYLNVNDEFNNIAKFQIDIMPQRRMWENITFHTYKVLDWSCINSATKWTFLSRSAQSTCLAWSQRAGVRAGLDLLMWPLSWSPVPAVDIILTRVLGKEHASQVNPKIFGNPWSLCFPLNTIKVLKVQISFYKNIKLCNPVFSSSLKHGQKKKLPS